MAKAVFVNAGQAPSSCQASLNSLVSRWFRWLRESHLLLLLPSGDLSGSELIDCCDARRPAKVNRKSAKIKSESQVCGSTTRSELVSDFQAPKDDALASPGLLLSRAVDSRSPELTRAWVFRGFAFFLSVILFNIKEIKIENPIIKKAKD